MRQTSYAAAIVEALRISLATDPHVSLVGSYVLGLGPKRVLMDAIRAEFPDRLYRPADLGGGPRQSRRRRGDGLSAAVRRHQHWKLRLCRLVAASQ